MPFPDPTSRSERPATIGEVDALLVAAHWRLLHARWSGATFDEQAAQAEIDALLDQRVALTTHGAAMRARMARRSAA
jgi:hypothetical protein